MMYKALVTALLLICNIDIALANLLPKSQFPLPEDLKKDNQQLLQLRHQFIEAESSLKNQDLERYNQLLDQLQSYPLYEYLLYSDAKRNLNNKSQQQVDSFLRQFNSSPLANSLRTRWLTYLRKSRNNSLFTQFFQPGLSTNLSCYFYSLKHKHGKLSNQDYAEVKKLWLVGKSQPKSCDPVFKHLVTTPHLTTADVWQRIELAMAKGNPGLARYLQRFLPKSQQHYVSLWRKIRSYPAEVNRSRNFKTYSNQEAAIALYGLKRLVRRDPNLAIKAFNKLDKKFSFSMQQRQETIQTYAKYLAVDDHPQAEQFLDQIEFPLLSSNLEQWLIATPLRRQDWPKVLERLAKLPDQQAQTNKWQYWRARALEQTGDRKQAKQLYLSIAADRDYYSFLSAARLGLSPNLQHNEPKITTNVIDSLTQYERIQKARELFVHDRLLQARRELNTVMPSLDNEQKKALAIVADSWGWHELAIMSYAQVRYWDDVSRRFPLAYQEIVNQSQQQKIDASWGYAIARQESAFMKDATSGAGARGLMQLLPSTATQMANQYQLKKPKVRDLYDPDTNVKFGTLYLKYLLERNYKNPILATAAYNAGPHRVARWMPKQQMPMDIWVETIPFNETRRYVKNVTAYQLIYASQLGIKDYMVDSIRSKQVSVAGVR